MRNDYKIIGERLEELMRKRGFTQKKDLAIAIEMGENPNRIKEWIDGKRKISYDNLDKLTTVLNASPDYLTGKSDAFLTKNEYNLKKYKTDKMTIFDYTENGGPRRREGGRMTKEESELCSAIQIELIRAITFMDKEKLLDLVKKAMKVEE